MKNFKYSIVSILAMGVLFLGLLNAESGKGSEKSQILQKPTVAATGTFDGNRIDNNLENNAMIVSQNVSGSSGMSWPKGNNTQSVYASGVWIGGKIGGVPHVSAGEYAGEFAAGPWGSDPTDPMHTIYKVNKTDLDNPLTNPHFQDWPTEFGAPWVDNNDNGTYDPLPAGPDHPEFIGDQVVYMVMNDGDPTTHSVFATNPMGIEMQTTIFGFDRADFLGDMMFVKTILINKGDNTIKDTYIGLWSDPDLGDAGDDFVGCDPDLGLGICYNDGVDAKYANYAGGTPAVGYDFFQGPIVPAPGEIALVSGVEIPDYRNLSMTSFSKYINIDDPVWSDPNDAEEAYNLMQGLMKSGDPFADNLTGGTAFVHPGDPNLDTGPGDQVFVDKDVHSSGDRRFLMNSGPFTMNPGDRQEVVFAIMHAAAGGPLNSYKYLKTIDKTAQFSYEIQFNVPSAPTSPEVTVTTFKDEIVLAWDNTVDSTPKDEVTGYGFEGYNVWQYETLSGFGDKKLIATYDFANGITEIYDDVFDPILGEEIFRRVQFGSDSGIKRSVTIKKDGLNNDTPLKTNRVYYFSVNAYSFNTRGVPKTLESSAKVFAVRPQISNTSEAGDEVAVYGTEIIAENAGTANAAVIATVVDPELLTGGSYEVFTGLQHYWAGLDGVWKTTDTQGVAEKRVGKVLDCDGSTVTLTGLDAADGTVDLTFTLDMHCGSNWVDGIMLDFADDVVINGWDPLAGGSYAQDVSNMSGTLDPATNSILWGDVSRSGYGAIEGSQSWTVNVQSISLPATVGYAIYDDGFDGTIIDVVSNAELGYDFVSLPYWYLMNSGNSEVLIEDQFVLNGVTLDHITSDGAYIEGGSVLGAYDFPLVDGFTVAVDGGYDAPEDFFNLDKTETDEESYYDIDSYMANGWGTTAKAIDTYGFGFTSVDVLQQDVKVVFDGVYGEPLANGFVPVVEGGSDAWVWNANTLATHTSPNNPGTGDPFLVRVPFKVYNMEAEGQPQINIILRDRIQPHDGTYDGDGDGIPETHAFNPYNRMYTWILNRPYDETLNDFASNEDFLTWNMVWWTTDWTIGDELLFEYSNPLQHGKDVFAFSTANLARKAKAYDSDDIKVWPNPYFGYNPEERDPIEQIVQFTHLPESGSCTIRIFNIAGVPVRTINHTEGTQFETWDLKNSFRIPVSSGMYIAVVETDEGSKVLKLAIIQPEQRLDVY